MTERLNEIVEDIATSVTSDNESASQALLQEVNLELRRLSEPERAYVANELSLKGLLPDLAIETGLVTENHYLTRDDLTRIADSEGNLSLAGMSAQFLVDNFSTVAGMGSELNSEIVSDFDQRYDFVLDTDQARREFSGLLSLASPETPKEGLTSTDIDLLLSKPDVLTTEQKESLTFMKEHFDWMKTPRGVAALISWSTPQITSASLEDFVGSTGKIWMSEMEEIAAAARSQQSELETAALEAQDASSSAETDSIETEYEVQSGDNLWKIARAYLTEKDQKRPSNSEVLELVNDIIERNQIPNADLIYPGQKIVIPGEDETTPGTPADGSETESDIPSALKYEAKS